MRAPGHHHPGYKKNWHHIKTLMPENAQANNGKQSVNFNRLRFPPQRPRPVVAGTGDAAAWGHQARR